MPDPEILYKGIEWRRRITVTEVDTGNRVNLTGKTISITFKRRSTEAALVTLTVGSGITLLTQSGATEGQADIVISAGSSSSWDVASHVVAGTVDAQVALDPLKVSVRAV